MRPIDIQPYFAPVSSKQPAGRELGSELYALADATKEPEEPGLKGVAAVDARNWNEILSRTQQLLSESRHLRVAVYLTRALLHTRGLVGYCTGVELIAGLVEHNWNGLWPALDEDGDSVARVNALKEVSSPEIMAQLRNSIVVGATGLGAFTVNDVFIAKGLVTPTLGSTPPNKQLIQKAFEVTTPADLRNKLDSVKAAIGALDKLPGLVFAKSGSPFDVGRAKAELERLHKVLAEHAPAVTLPAPSPASAVEAGPSEPEAHPMQPNSGIHGRADVLQALDKLCEYYERYEPSSPVPLLLQRAKRLATMSFVAIMRELADKGIPQLEALTGKDNTPS